MAFYLLKLEISITHKALYLLKFSSQSTALGFVTSTQYNNYVKTVSNNQVPWRRMVLWDMIRNYCCKLDAACKRQEKFCPCTNLWAGVEMSWEADFLVKHDTHLASGH